MIRARKVNIIAHSMGGLDARYAIAKLGLADRVASLVTIGTPHLGTPLANLGARLSDLLRLKSLLGRVVDIDAFYNLTSDAHAGASTARSPTSPASSTPASRRASSGLAPIRCCGRRTCTCPSGPATTTASVPFALAALGRGDRGDRRRPLGADRLVPRLRYARVLRGAAARAVRTILTASVGRSGAQFEGAGSLESCLPF